MKTFNKIIADIVQEDYRTADVLKKFGLNYCCNGNLFLQDACNAKGIDYDNVIDELRSNTRDVYIPNFLPFDKWDVEFLTDYILNVHHAYLKTAIPSIQSAISTFLVSDDGDQKNMKDVQDVFDYLAAFLITHNLHEEEIIFPYIKHIAATHRRKETYGSLFVRTLRKPLNNIQKDHTRISELVAQLRQLTNDYALAATAGTNLRVVMCKLKEFDNDLIQHKHLENNILFPKAIELEAELLQVQTL